MNLPEYRVTEFLSHGRPWLEHVASPEDKKLFGSRGYIWKCAASETFGAWVTSHRLINSKFPVLGVVHKKGAEHRVFFPQSELKRMIALLGVPKSGAKQISLLEAFERGDTSKIDEKIPMISTSCTDEKQLQAIPLA